MWIHVRTMDGGVSQRIDNLSKLTKIEDLRKKLVELFECPHDRQRLFFRGKQLEDSHSLFDYNVGLNDLVQLYIRPAAPLTPSTDTEQNNTITAGAISRNNRMSTNQSDTELLTDDNNTSSSLLLFPVNRQQISNERSESSNNPINSVYKIGQVVDARNLHIGCWFESKIKNVKYSSSDNGDLTENNVIYIVNHIDDEITDDVELTTDDIRPRAVKQILWDELVVGDVVLANYNPDAPRDRGYWYHFQIQQIKTSRTRKELLGRLVFGENVQHLENCKVKFSDVYKIPEPGQETTEELTADKRLNRPECNHCFDNVSVLCKHCSCYVCGGKEHPDKQILCDECNMAYHFDCLHPPITAVPDDDEWYCPRCKNDSNEVIKAGEKLRESKKKSNMPSAKQTCKRDWGKGMACVGRTKICSIVRPNHFGEIPGVEVGMSWKFRFQVSEAGIHRPHVGGIHGREDEGAYSIVLSGGYEDDEDRGDYFTYTGSGGRDLSGNKRTAPQSSDQKLSSYNKALAKNCNAPLDSVNGGEAKEWTAGKPVRVVRNWKGKKHSKYCPTEGNRYDGLYKVVKYWPEMGKSGFRVWRYMLRRDDTSAAPWTKDGQKKIKSLNLTMQYPEGYLEAQSQVENVKSKRNSETNETNKNNQQSQKRKRQSQHVLQSPIKKHKSVKVADNVVSMLDEDEANSKIWNELSAVIDESSTFLKRVEEMFQCICCQEVVCRPVTTSCGHNICKDCLSRSFKASVYTCPYCRYDLGKNTPLTVNKHLQDILLLLFPGYEAGR